MKPGLPTSLALHASLLTLALLSWGRAHDEPIPTEIPVEITIADTTVNRLGERNAPKAEEITPKSTKAAAKEREGKRAGDSKQEEPPPPPPQAKPQPPQETASLPKQEQAPDTPPPEPPKVKPEPPKPVAKPEPPKPETPPEDKPKVAEKAPEIAKEPPPPKPEPPKKDPPKPEPPKPEPPKESKDTKALDKLIADAKESPKAAPAKPAPAKPAPAPAPQVAKADPAKAAPAPSPQKSDSQSKAPGEFSDIVNKALTGTAQGAKQQTASLGSPNGINAKVKMSASELDAFMGQVQKCWNPPPGSSEAGLKARIHVVLLQDGTLGAIPTLIEASSHPMGPAFANSAIRAIRMCAPYNLPAAKFNDWQDNTLTFVPFQG
jgi:hypothetical protein